MRLDLLKPSELGHDEIVAWEALQASHPCLANPFLSPHWPLALVQVNGPDRRAGRIIVVRDDHDAPVGFLPLRLGRRAALPMGSPVADYQAFVAAAELDVDPRDLVRAS